MDYDEYVRQAQEGARLDEAGDTKGALAIFESLVDAKLAVVDRAMMCNNVALLLEKLGRTNDALQAYDHGIALETPLCRSLSAEQKAGLLTRLGRNGEALALYRVLLDRSWASESEKERFRGYIATLSGG